MKEWNFMIYVLRLIGKVGPSDRVVRFSGNPWHMF